MDLKTPCFSKAVSCPVFFFLLTFLLLPIASASEETSQSPRAALEAADLSVATYDQLLSAIRQTRQASQERIETAVSQEKVREAWETGKLIEEHILLNKDRAEYGKKVMGRLAADLDTSERELNYMVEFAREYPIAPTSAQLSWGHYRDLLAINNAKQRDEIAKEAAENKWPLEEMRQQIKKRKLSAERSTLNAKLPETQPGKVGTYRIVDLRPQTRDTKPGELYLDFGFSFYKKISPEDQKRFKAGDFVQLSQKGFASRVSGLESELYTYPAHVTDVYDGDTFHALIDLGHGRVTRQRVRLRRVDAPEIESAEGKEAKAYLEKIFARTKGEIILKTYDFDQHGRPLADVYVEGNNVDQGLVDAGLATRMEE